MFEMDKQEKLRYRLKIVEANIKALWNTKHLVALKHNCMNGRKIILKKLLKHQLLEFNKD